MRTIELEANVAEDGKLIINLPPDVPPGHYQVVVVIAGEEATITVQPAQRLPLHPHQIEWDIMPEKTTFSREELYEDAW